MPLITTYVDAPGIETDVKTGEAKIYQFTSKKEFSPDHTLNLAIYRTSLREGCELSSKLLPIVVAMWEQKGNYRLTDFYSFDHNAILLSHGYSRWNGDEKRWDAHEEHDTSLDRLIEHGESIREMIGEYSIDATLAMTNVVIDLREGTLRS